VGGFRVTRRVRTERPVQRRWIAFQDRRDAIETVVPYRIEDVDVMAALRLDVGDFAFECRPAGEAVLDGERVLYIAQQGSVRGIAESAAQARPRRLVTTADGFQPPFRFALEEIERRRRREWARHAHLLSVLPDVR